MKRYGRVLNQRVAAFSQQKLMCTLGPVLKYTEEKLVQCSVDGAPDSKRVDLVTQIVEIIRTLSNFRVSTALNMERGGFQYSEKAYAEPLPLQWASVLGLALRLLRLPLDRSDLFSVKTSLSRGKASGPIFGKVIFTQSRNVLRFLNTSMAHCSFLSLARHAVPAMVQHATKAISGKGLLQAEINPILYKILELAVLHTSERLGITALVTALDIIPSLCLLPASAHGDTQHPLPFFAQEILATAGITTQRLLLEPTAEHVNTWLGVCLSLGDSLAAIRCAPVGLREVLTRREYCLVEKVLEAFVEQGTAILQLPPSVLGEESRSRVEYALASLKPGIACAGRSSESALRQPVIPQFVHVIMC
jgi:hypothetical protein